MSSDYLNYEENLAFPPQDNNQSSSDAAYPSSSDLIRGSTTDTSYCETTGKGSPDYHTNTDKIVKLFNCGEAAVAKSNREFTLEKKLAIAVEGINSAAAFLTCMDDLSEITGTSNEQAALDELNKALEKMKA